MAETASAAQEEIAALLGATLERARNLVDERDWFSPIGLKVDQAGHITTETALPGATTRRLRLQSVRLLQLRELADGFVQRQNCVLEGLHAR